MKKFYVSVILIMNISLSSAIYSEEPAVGSLAGISQTLLKEVGDVEDKLYDAEEKIKEVKKELADVRRIATGTMEAPKPKEDVLEVTKTHIKAVDTAKEDAIGLHATPTGTSLPQLVDKLTKTQEAYKKANEELQKTITDEKLLEKLRSVAPAPAPEPVTIPPMALPEEAPAALPLPEPEPVEEEPEPAPEPEPVMPKVSDEEEETLMNILGEEEEKPANEKKKMSKRQKRKLKQKYLL